MNNKIIIPESHLLVEVILATDGGSIWFLFANEKFVFLFETNELGSKLNYILSPADELDLDCRNLFTFNLNNLPIGSSFLPIWIISEL